MRRISLRTLLWLGLMLLSAGALLLWKPWLPQDVCQVAGEGPDAVPVWTGEGRRLEPRKLTHCKFPGDLAHSHQAFRISLEAGQYLDLAIDPEGIDVSAALWSPQRQALLEIDSPPGGAEKLYFIAPQAGEYGLVISSEEKGEAGRRRKEIH
jgi:hypothetical protein